MPPEGRIRVAIDAVAPTVAGGAHAVKRVVGEPVDVEADLVADGHDVVRAVVRHRPAPDGRWAEVEMTAVNPGLDRWRARFTPRQEGTHEFVVRAWVDPFATWLDGTAKKLAAGQDVTVDLLAGADLVDAARARIKAAAAVDLERHSAALRRGDPAPVLDPTQALAKLMRRHGERRWWSESPCFTVAVDRARAGFSAWYELFPRSTGPPGRHGTLADVAAVVPRIAAMGFDVLYLPPIHPIGETARKGPANRLTAGPADPGSPWAIGSAAGGHTAIHPELGGEAELRALVAATEAHGIDLALDLAFQCSPDHPWIGEHPEWFRHRPDGSIQHAENPPKKYEDIVPLDFETDAWPELWAALRGVVGHWVERGIRVFRVDNPHTKSFAFWEWLIADVKAEDPGVLFLAEAFTRPRVMERLAKIGFTQSYTYFAWRRTAPELRAYFEELTRTDRVEWMRPNVWPNTPDILTDQLQTGERGVFASRAVLAATLAANYGVYGPAFELLEHRPREPGSEEYLDSEKYELRDWDVEAPHSLAPLLTRLNRIRRAHPALHTDRSLRFHDVEGDDLLAYSKRTEDGSDVVLTVVNTDGRGPRQGLVHLDLAELGVAAGEPFTVHDRLGDGRWTWTAATNYVELSPELPAHVFAVGGPP